MQHPGFFKRSGPFTVSALAERLDAECTASSSAAIEDVKTLQDAGPQDAAFFNNPKYLAQLHETKAGVCLVAPKFADKLPSTTVALVVAQPYHAWAELLALFYPDSLSPCTTHPAAAGDIAPSARIEDDVIIEPNVVIGPEVQIGSGSRICAGAVLGYRCTVGRNAVIGPRVTLTHALVGDNVIIHAGASIGQDGFGFAMGAEGHKKVPQLGRVIIQDQVEIGANTTIDRGALNDTIIGEGTKIDNLVQIGHNVVIGRHCVIVALAGLAGSCELGDFVVLAGKSGVAGHIKIGTGAQIAGGSHAVADVPPGAKMGGTPATSFRQWARERATLSRLAARGANQS